MSTTSAAVTPTLNVISTIPDPTAKYSTPAAAVQVQNASPFILSVSEGGEVYTLQSFTAQTIPTANGGTSMTVIPTSGPAGTQGSITCVWLQPNEAPPMADGQLTGAAQYAVGLGSTLYSNTFSFGAGGGQGPGNVQLSPTTRTLILLAVVSGAAPTLLGVIGATTGYVYRTGAPYLQISPNSYLACVPVMPLLDPIVTINWQFGTTSAGAFTVEGDTLQYDESVFYNGPTVVSAATNVNGHILATGPCRLISAWVNGNGAASGGVNVGGGTVVRVDTAAGETETMELALPQPFIVPANVQVTAAIAGSVVAGAATAYP